MGCDISVFLEIDKGEEAPFSSPFTTSIGSGEFLAIERNYDLFAALAGVRNDGSIINPVKPRGIPQNLSWKHIPYFFTPIKEETDHLPAQLWYSWNQKEYYSREEAEQYVKNGSVSYNQPLMDQQLKAGQLITRLDAHSFSWLLLEEIKSAITLNNLTIKDENLLILLSTMEVIELSIGAGKTRMLFYFDN